MTLYCPKCGKELRKIGREKSSMDLLQLGVIEYDTYCDNCEILVSVEDRSAFEQEGKTIITLA